MNGIEDIGLWDLMNLYNTIGVEILKRTWWVWGILLLFAIVVSLKSDNKGRKK